jgi:multidrug efflux pump subunit AcrA (membrane-fusion protein)
VVFPVEVVVARRSDFNKGLSTTGVICANRKVEIVVRTARETTFVGAQNGEFVKQGDVLVKMDDREHRIAYERASAGLLLARIEHRTLSTLPFIENADSAALKQKRGETQEHLRDAELRFKLGTISGENLHG